MLLLWLEVPSIAKRKEGEAIFRSMLEIYVRHRGTTVAAKIAMFLGGAERSKNSWAMIEERTAQLYREVSENGADAVNSERLLAWFQSVGISGDDPSEVEALFYAFDDDGCYTYTTSTTSTASTAFRTNTVTPCQLLWFATKCMQITGTASWTKVSCCK